MRPTQNAITLRRAVPASAIDPITQREIEQCPLPAGTVLLGARRALCEAIARGQDTVTLCVNHDGAWSSLVRIAVSDLRDALPGLPAPGRLTA